jgi:hypothetical protein
MFDIYDWWGISPLRLLKKKNDLSACFVMRKDQVRPGLHACLHVPRPDGLAIIVSLWAVERGFKVESLAGAVPTQRPFFFEQQITAYMFLLWFRACLDVKIFRKKFL